MVFDQYMQYSLWNNTVQQYLIALGVLILSVIVLRIFKFVIVKRLHIISRKTKNQLDDIIVDVINAFHWPFYVFISLYIALKFIKIPEIIGKVEYYILYFFLTYYIVKTIQNFINIAAEHMIKKNDKNGGNTTSMKVLKRFLNVIVWVIALIFVTSNLGFDVTGLVAGLGIGGIAIAFALQNVLEDIFASFSIHIDKPFSEGDYIVVGDEKGTVKKIGIKTTRIKASQGEEIVISNRKLTENIVHNYKKLEKRRGTFSFGVTYDTPVSKLRKIPGIIENIFSKVEKAAIDRVHFTEFGDFSLNYDIVFYVDSNKYSVYKDIQQEINLQIKEQFEKQKIEMAFPTQTLFVHKAK